MMLRKTVLVGFFAYWASLSVFALPNPASKNCVQEGRRSEIRSTDRGDQYGVCIWGTRGNKYSECEEWQLFHGQCEKGECPQWGADYDANGHFISFCTEEF